MKFDLFFVILLIITTIVSCLEPDAVNSEAKRDKRDDFNIEDFKLGPMVRTKPEDFEMEKKAQHQKTATQDKK